MERRRNAIIGMGALLVAMAFLYGLFLYLGGSLKSGNTVAATFERAGQLLRNGSDVKMRGVLVGSVSGIEVGRLGHARVELLLDPTQVIPKNISAAIRAKTLFGEKYVDLVPPAVASDVRLSDGDEIPLDRTTPPIEVEAILEKGVPLLEAVDPEQFGAGLHGLAVAFVTGNEEALRRVTPQSLKLLTETEKTLPNLERNLAHLRTFAAAFDDTDTDLLDALDALAEIGGVIRDNPEAFRRTVSGLVPLANDLGDIITARHSDLSDIAREGRAVLETVAKRADTLPGTVEVLDGFLGVWVMDLSEGPYWRISVTDPPIIVGDPYEPGEAPSPRTVAAVSLDAKLVPAAERIAQILLAPIQGRMPRARDDVDPLVASLLQGLGS